MNTAENQDKQIFIQFSEDNMEAHIMLTPSAEGYHFDEVMEFLKSKGVIYGILEQEIRTLICNKLFNSYVLIAKGTQKIDGRDGYFDFMFDHKRDNKPKILVDGSVDYRTFQVIQVKEGDVLVRYTPAYSGEKGTDVKGKTILPYRGKDNKPIKGKGFVISEDRQVYTAAISGKVEYIDEKLLVSNVYELKGDVDHLTGDVDFEGDVVIYGNVTLGTKVFSKGSVTVQGHMEGAEIIAGKNVTLQNGAQGAGRGLIEAKGNVSGKFFEQMTIKAGGDVNANSILNCEVECGGEVTVSGKLGILVGGRIRSLKQITATIIGNMAEIRTDLEVGLPDSTFLTISTIENDLQKKNILLNKINEAEEALKNISTTVSPELVKQKKMEVMRTKIKLNMEISELTKKRSELISQLDYVPYSKVTAVKRLYPGVRITINGEITLINDIAEDVTVRRKGHDVCLFANHS